MFGHAISTHKASPEIDFFAAVDDLQPIGESGAAITGHLEYNSAVYYRYTAVNVDLLRENLPGFSNEELLAVLDTFIRSSVISVPVARKNSYNGHTIPSYVLGIVRRGHPINLANAFEKPISAKNGSGIIEPSIKALKAHHKKQKWILGIENGVDGVKEIAIPEVNLKTFCQTLLNALFPTQNQERK